MNRFPRPELVLFDLDGTLVDSVPDLAYSIDAMLEQLGLPMRGEQQVRDWVGNGAEKLVKRSLTGNMDDEPEDELFHRGFHLFSEYYVKNSNRSTLYPGVREGVDHLRSRGCKLGCVTNKRGRFTEPLLRSLGLFDDFSVVVSGDTLPQMKPAPEPLLHASGTVDVEPQQTLMIGDSINDVLAARAAGMPVLCVRYGYNCGRNIEESNPDAVLDSLSELTELI